MNWLVNLWGSEPVVITGLVGAVLGLLASFNLGLSPDQMAAVDAVIVAIGVLIARSQVSSPTTVAALEAGKAMAVPPSPTAPVKP